MYVRGQVVIVNGGRVDNKDGICSHIAVGTRKNQGYSAWSRVYRNPQVAWGGSANLIQLETFLNSRKDNACIDWDILKSLEDDR